MSSIKSVTQITSKTTGVNLSAYNSRITTVALTDAADTGFEFTLTNDKITTKSLIMLTVLYAGTTGTPIARLVSQAKGSCVIRITNVGTAVLNAACSVNVYVNPNVN